MSEGSPHMMIIIFLVNYLLQGCATSAILSPSLLFYTLANARLQQRWQNLEGSTNTWTTVHTPVVQITHALASNQALPSRAKNYFRL